MAVRIRLDPQLAAPVLRMLAPATRRTIREQLRALARDPTGLESHLDIRELDREGKLPRVFRLRVADWRIAYVVRESEVLVIRIFHRRDGYGWMERLDQQG